MGLNQRLNKLEQERDDREEVLFWGPPFTEEERQARLDAGCTPESHPHCFWPDDPELPLSERKPQSTP